jgi:plasmid maintenance system antidote protein VapI
MNTDYKEHLEFILDQRRQRNPSYSLRAFARDLRIDPSDLANIMKGKKKVTPKVSPKPIS